MERTLAIIKPDAVAARHAGRIIQRIEESGFGRFFSHGTGHGLGLEVHEAPALRPNSDAVLERGMIVTVEPGIYVPGEGGVRVEDNVLITHSGCEVLTSLDRTLEGNTLP